MQKVIVTALLLLLVTTCTFCRAQSVQQDLTLKYVAAIPSQKAAKTPIIILLHSYGSDEQDMFGLKNTFPPNYLIVSARAPYPISGAGFQWFDLHKADAQSEINSSSAQIVKFIAEVVTKYKADSRQVYLMGFSQGAMMSLQVGLKNPDKVKGVGILSGRLFPALKNEIKVTPALKNLKIFIGHGTADERIKFQEGKDAVEYLQSIGLKPDFHAYSGMKHAISNDELKDLQNWLK